MQIFTKNQTRWQQKPTPPAEVARWFARQQETGIGPVLSHASYLLNLGTPDEALWRKSVAGLVDELQRAEQLGLEGVVLHPGAHVGTGEAAGLARVAEGVNEAHAATPDLKTLTLLETTAGQGSTLGYTFEQLRAILDQIVAPERVAFCFDTCHVFAAGYDLRTPEEYQRTVAAFERVLGLERLRCFHFNDSKKGLGERVDRHEHIGEGVLGLEPFAFILNDPRFVAIPKILETPKSEDMHEDAENLARLRALLPDEG